MRVFALGDLHLSFSVCKPMDRFGPLWEQHTEKIETAWQETVTDDDLVLIPGDISWAMRLEEVLADLSFIGRLNGKKAMIRGNHDYWWNSLTKLRSILPNSVYALQCDALQMGCFSVGGTRLWDLEQSSTTAEGKKIYDREMIRLMLSLDRMDKNSKRIVMTHYPPFDAAHPDAPAVEILEQYGIGHVVYGHLHGKAHKAAFNGDRNGVDYRLVSADYLDFRPLQIL